MERPPTLDLVHFTYFPIGFHFWHTFFFFPQFNFKHVPLKPISTPSEGGNPEQERWWMVLTLLLMPLTCICAFWSVHLREWPFAAAWDHWSQLVIGQHQCRRPSKAAVRLFEKRDIHWNFTWDHVHIFLLAAYYSSWEKVCCCLRYFWAKSWLILMVLLWQSRKKLRASGKNSELSSKSVTAVKKKWYWRGAIVSQAFKGPVCHIWLDSWFLYWQKLNLNTFILYYIFFFN